MDRLQELEMVKTAFFLEERLVEIKNEEVELNGLKPKRPNEPIKPVEKKVPLHKLPYPEIKAEVTMPNFLETDNNKYLLYGSIGALAFSFIIMPILSGLISGIFNLFGIIFFIAGVVGFILLGTKYNDVVKAKEKAKNEKIEAIRTSEEYQEQCKSIDEKNIAMQAELDKASHEEYVKKYEKYEIVHKQYEDELNNYNSVLIPDWSAKVNDLRDIKAKTREVLNELYDKNVIPIQYRNIPALSYLALFLNTSEYDLKFAIERYDNSVNQRIQLEHLSVAKAQYVVAQEALANQQYSNWLNEQLVELNESGNDTLRSIDKWQKADIALREYRKLKARKAMKKR